ncbi:unnamed protein product [Peniophora sp. CBMAI 1063]|nr:unnamed protein product [Peniophora sp. CBMAI 1063]
MLSREDLKRMRRTELQRLSKTYGIRANLKTEELVELLASESERAVHPVPTPTIPVNSRSVPSRVGSRTRPRLQSNNTIVQHDDTDATDDGALTPVPLPESEVAPSPVTTTGPATRTRKAKNTQLRLGVGRPTAAGGPGPRAVTRADSQPKVKRAKPSRVGRPAEEPIAEEQPQDVDAVITPIAGPSQTRELRARTTEISIVTLPEDARAHIRQVVEEQVQPLLSTVAALRQELDESATAHRKEVDALRKRVDDLTSEVESCRRQAHSLEGLRSTVEQMTIDTHPARKSSEPFPESMKFGLPSRGSQPPISQPTHAEYRSGPIIEFPPPPSTKKSSKEQGYYALGKRRRPLADEVPSSTPVAGPSRLPIVESRETLEGPHPHKRLRLDSTVERGLTLPAYEPPQDPDVEPGGIPAPQPFTIYAGPEEEESLDAMNAQSTDRDFDSFDAPQVHARVGGPVTSTAHALENQRQTFPFSGLGGGLVPGTTMTPDTHAPVPAAGQTDDSPVVNHFPFPAAPHSPTPAPTSRIGGGPRAGSSQPTIRMSVEPTPAPAPHPATPPSTFTHPHTFGLGANGMQYSAIAAALQQTPPAHRTLYGTEVGQDTRFGDFGFDWNHPIGR